jgi:hypothetical protein
MHIHISYEGSRIYDKRGDANRRHFLQTSYIDNPIPPSKQSAATPMSAKHSRI